MPKARIFISSTCYDLGPVREELDSYLSSLGLEVLNSQKSSFGVTPGIHSHSACIEQVRESDFLLLIIGKRRGGTYVGSEKSITNEEFNEAKKIALPIIGCVDKTITDHLSTYKKNPTGDFSSVVDDNRVFHFVEYVNSGATDNWLHKYSSIEDIRAVIKGQISHYLSLYSKGLRIDKTKTKKENSPKSDVAEFPTSINDFSNEEQDDQTMIKNGLRGLYKVLSHILKSGVKQDVKNEQLKCLWVIARYGELKDGHFIIDSDVFKQFAWSTHRGQRVFNQMRTFGIIGEYEADDSSLSISLSFEKESDDSSLCWALKKYVQALVKKHAGDDGLAFLYQADMNVFSC